MLVDGVRLVGTKIDLFLHCFYLYYSIENIIWPLRYCFTVNLSTILVGQFRSSEPPRWGSEKWEPTWWAKSGLILRLKGAMI